MINFLKFFRFAPKLVYANIWPFSNTVKSTVWNAGLWRYLANFIWHKHYTPNAKKNAIYQLAFLPFRVLCISIIDKDIVYIDLMLLFYFEGCLFMPYEVGCLWKKAVAKNIAMIGPVGRQKSV